MDPDRDPNAVELMRRMQGNVLKSHGRQFTRLLLFRFHRRDNANRRVFPAARKQTPKLITSALEQYQASPSRSGFTSTEFYGVALTNEGLNACGYSGSDGDFPPELDMPEFRNGVKTDPAWDSLYRNERRPIHGLWLLAHESDAMLSTMENKVEKLLRSYAAIVGREDGFMWCDQPPAGSPPGTHGAAREPFGFRDGISEPIFIASAGVRQPWVQADLVRVIIPDGGPHFAGSFMVFSKLDQNVQLFRATESRMANLPPTIRDAGALFIGRERDGTPLAPPGAGGLNDFDFEPSPEGAPHSDARCPFHAHIRKSNPRTTSDVVKHANVSKQSPKLAQFVRRSVVYDQPPEGQPKQLPAFASPDYPAGAGITGNVGLLFMGYMRDIGEQFNTIRDEWFHNEAFPVPETRHDDPLLGAPDKPWSWPSVNPTVTVGRRPQFIRPRGDLFLYAPPITWLEAPPK